MDHELEVVVQGQVGRGDRGADDVEEGRLEVVWMQQIAVECIHVGGTEDGYLVAMAETHLKWESAVAHVGLVSVQYIAAVDVEHVHLVAYNKTHWEREGSAPDGSGNL